MNHTDFIGYIEEGQKNIDHTQTDISIICEKLGFNSEDKAYNPKKYHNFIYEGIDKLLGGNDFDRSQFNKIRSRLAIELFVDDNDANKKAFQCIEIINDAVRKTINFSNEPKKWIQSMEFISALLVAGGFDPLTHVDMGYKKEKALAESFKYLTHKGYCIEIIEDSLRCNMDEHRKICSVIDSKLKLLGEIGICEIVIKIENLYDKEIERYIFPRVSEFPLVPWGFLFKLAIKNFGKTMNLQNPSEVWKEVIELSANYATMLGIQEYSNWEIVFVEPRDVLETLQKLVLNDQVYSISQVRSSHILEFIEKIFLNEPFNSYLLPWCISDYKLVVETIINLAKTKTPFKFTAKKIFDNIGCELHLEKIVHILDGLSHGEGALNKKFLIPFDSLENNINLKPLVKTGELEYMILDLPLFCYGFYEVLYQACLSFGLKEIEMGAIIESFVRNKFTEASLRFMHGEKYKLDSSMRTLLGTKKEDGAYSWDGKCCRSYPVNIKIGSQIKTTSVYHDTSEFEYYVESYFDGELASGNTTNSILSDMDLINSSRGLWAAAVGAITGVVAAAPTVTTLAVVGAIDVALMVGQSATSEININGLSFTTKTGLNSYFEIISHTSTSVNKIVQVHVTNYRQSDGGSQSSPTGWSEQMCKDLQDTFNRNLPEIGSIDE